MRSTLVEASKHAAIVCAAAIFAVAATAPALAEVSRIVVKDAGPMGTFGGRQYTWVTAAMEGTVARNDGTTGHYRVPVSLMYSDRDPNGFGFVDVVNSADFHVYLDDTAPMGKRKIYYVGDVIFSDYLRREGFVYIAVQWARMVTEELGTDYGVIEDGRDGHEIVKDAARLLRSPQQTRRRRRLPTAGGRPCDRLRVLADGIASFGDGPQRADPWPERGVDLRRCSGGRAFWLVCGAQQ